MDDTNSNSIADDLLDQAQKKIDDAFRQKGLAKTDRAVLEVQNSVLMFLRDDHKKTNEMYPYYKEMSKRNQRAEKLFAIAASTALAALAMLVLNGILFLLSTTPLMQAIIQSSQP